MMSTHDQRGMRRPLGKVKKKKAKQRYARIDRGSPILLARAYRKFVGATGSELPCEIERPNDPKLIRKNETKRPIQVFALYQMITAPTSKKAKLVTMSKLNTANA
jgi:hypothetical protein